MTASNPGLYIHIPFCEKKCSYCAFNSFPAGESEREEYLNALCAELAGRSDEAKKIDTVYIGGGTPTVLSASQFSQILTTVYSHFDLMWDAEITVEANPATVDMKKLRAIKTMGVNRISLGVQSMDDGVLKALGRIHTSGDVLRDYDAARTAGYDNISMDLMFATPVSDVEKDLASLEKIISLRPDHISYYGMQLEEGTEFYRLFEAGRLAEASDDAYNLLYHTGCEMMKAAGYSHYEISNFALEGKESRHNLKYWNMADYIGAGLGASSFINGIRLVNESGMEDYLDKINSGKRPFAERYENTGEDMIAEAMFTGLRKREGVKFGDVFDAPDAAAAKERFFEYFDPVREEIDGFIEAGYLEITNDSIRLTEEGIDISNTIMALFV